MRLPEVYSAHLPKAGSLPRHWRRVSKVFDFSGKNGSHTLGRRVADVDKFGELIREMVEQAVSKIREGVATVAATGQEMIQGAGAAAGAVADV